MKKLLIFLVFTSSMTACEFIYVEDTATDSLFRMSGTYRVEEYSRKYQNYHRYSIWVARSSHRHGLRIDNVYDEGLTVEASVYGTTIEIPYQVVNGFAIEGTGYWESDHISLDYTIVDTYSPNSRMDFCDLSGWRD
jgi:hypothetical protein